MNKEVRPELEIVLKVKLLLSSPEKWIKGAAAKNRLGDIVSARDKDAICFCLVGATRRADPYFKFNTSDIFEPAMAGTLKGSSISNWNDAPERTYEDVVEFLNKTEEYYIAR